jgi:glycolate oxidase FAD binding subunit
LKNVAGYDLSKLFTGSYGTLGIVTEAIFRLRPWPPRRLFVTATYADEAALAPALAGVVRSQAALSAVEVDRPVATGAIGLSVLLEGRPGPVDERAHAVSELLGGAEVSDHEPEGFAVLPGPVTFKVTTPPGSVAALLVLLRALAGEHQVWPAVRGSAGVGALFVGFAGDEAAGPLAAFLSGVRAGCARRGGSATVLRAPAPVKASLDVWGPVPGLDLMRRVKRQFDPDGRLAPGRFVGGL